MEANIDYQTITFTAGDPAGAEKCVICFDPLKTKESVKMNCCSKIFHKACIDTNVYAENDNTCPLCKAKITELVSGRTPAVSVEGDAGAALDAQVVLVRAAVGERAIAQLVGGDASLRERLATFRRRFDVATPGMDYHTRSLILGEILAKVRHFITDSMDQFDAEAAREFAPRAAAPAAPRAHAAPVAPRAHAAAAAPRQGACSLIGFVACAIVVVAVAAIILNPI